MWIDIGKQIRESVPDKNGKPLPGDLVSGSYEIRDLTNRGVGTLFEGKVIYDKTYGHVTYGCGSCCGFKRTLFWFDPLGIPFQDPSDNGVNGLDTCYGQWLDVSGDMYGNWTTANTSIATVDYYGTHTGQSIGSTTSSTFGFLDAYSIRVENCPINNFGSGGGDNTMPKVTLSCTPADLAMGPTAPVTTTNGSCSTQVSPSGGSYSWSVNKNTVTLSGTNTGAIGFTPASPSSSQGDTSITVKYTVNNQSTSVTSGAITTHNPTSLTVVSDTTDPAGNSCTVPCLANPGDGTCNVNSSSCSYNSYLRQRKYSVVDQLNQQFTNVGITSATVTETVPFTTTCLNQSINSGSATQTVFIDKFYMCNRCCQPGGPGCSCQTNPVQTEYVNGIQVGTEQITWSCTGVSLIP
jgi:hypothetical protein